MAFVATDLRDLPSTVDENLILCPRFRILVVGTSGVGKSSLISNIFNLSLKDIDIAHNRAGKADVKDEYTSERNPYLILHDTQGFEPGKIENWKIVEDFLRDRSAETTELKDRVHAIWLCIETPRTGARKKETGDEKLLSLAKELGIPAVAVFTKFDLLVNEHRLKAQAQNPRATKKELQVASQTNAEEDFKLRIESTFLEEQVPCVRVSNQENHTNTLDRLSEVIYQSLPEDGGQVLSWVAAQQVNARQKVNESIRQGCKRYWLNLGQSAIFQGHKLIECLSRISQDILRIWNFNDPDNLLSSRKFIDKIARLVQEFSPQAGGENNRNDRPVNQLLSRIIRNSTSSLIQALDYLYNAIPATAQYLGAYIIDFIVVLHRIFTALLHIKSSKIVSESLIDEQIRKYKRTDLAINHELIRGVSVTAAGFERRVAGLIRESLKENYTEAEAQHSSVSDVFQG